MACDEIYLADDGNSAVSFPEVPLLAVLPGTGGLTRLTDKRRVRRDRADVFCTLAEGIKGRRAVEWNLVDGLFPRSSFEQRVEARVAELCREPRTVASWPGLPLAPVEGQVSRDALEYRHVRVSCDPATHTAQLTIHGPDGSDPKTPEAMLEVGNDFWPPRAFRELDLALCHLRFDFPEINVVAVRTQGDPQHLLALDAALHAHREHGFVRETLGLMARVLRRFDLTAKSFFALVEPGSCFAGSLLEVLLASDRAYLLLDGPEVGLGVSQVQADCFPMSHGMSRLAARFLGEPERVSQVLAHAGRWVDGATADDLGLVTMALDDLDYEDETRIALEERASLSPDALTGMEASLRFPGTESTDTKIFGRLSAWQNWIFQRPNAVGQKGALTTYGQPQRAEYDFRRT